ncbi:TRAP transporter small permease [Aquibacillus sediminis]|uniref:TRAP transporter small permease n=1 Tax=Aquibacillus sediminis TaxID=2574734 RepID=UPI001485C654|nr:TRAP transporter small permease [Aquibacillus sediminis]
MINREATNDIELNQAPIATGNKNFLLSGLLWIDKWILRAFERLVLAVSLLSLSIIVFSIVITRYFFDYAPPWSDELPRYIMVWLTFIGMSYCVRKGEHVVVDILFARMKGKFKKYYFSFTLLVCTVFSGILTYYGWNLTLKMFEINQQSVSLGIPMAYIYLAIPVGCFLMAKNFLHLLIVNIFGKEVVTKLNEGGEDE